MKKKLLTLTIVLAMVLSIDAQNTMTVQAGAVLTMTGGAVITLQDMNLSNSGTMTYAPGNGTIEFRGTTESVIGGSSPITFDVLRMNKTGAGFVTIDRDINVSGSINFTAGNLLLNANHIMLQPASLLVNEGETSRITDNGAGYVEISVPLSNPAAVNPGNLGAVITTTQNMGSTRIRRMHNVATIGAGSSIHRRYEIAPTNNAALNATLRFHYLDAELGGLTESSLLTWKSPDNVTWTDQGFNSRDAVANYVEKTGIADFSFWTLALPGGALPVVFSQLNVRCESNGTRVNWRTEQESSSAKFNIERSSDGNNWSLVGSVNAAGSSNMPIDYTYNDLTATTGSYFYRVVEVGLSGNRQLTSIIRSACTGNFSLSLFPNPARDKANLSIQLPAAASINLTVFNAKGQLVYSTAKQLLSGTSLIEIPLQRLASGMYHVRVQEGINVIGTFSLVKE